MPVQVFLSTTLRNRFAGYDPQTGILLSVPQGTTVEGLCHSLGIPPGEVKLVMIDGRASSMSHVLKGDERIGLFPPVGGG